MDLFTLVGKISVNWVQAEEALKNVRKEAGETKKDMDSLGDAAAGTKAPFDRAADSIGNAQEAVQDIGDAADRTEKSMEDMGAGAEKAEDAVRKTGDAAKDARPPIEDSGAAARNADKDFSAWKVTLANLAAEGISRVIDGCGQLAGKVLDVGTDTESAFAKLETIAGTENIESLKESISGLSKETGVSSANLANVAYNAISAGSDAENAAEMVGSAVKLAAAGFTDSESALSVISTAVNSYGDAAGTAAEISDSLITTQNLGVTTIGELSGSIGRAIATGSAYNVSLGNIESAYISLTKSGISTEESTTYLSSMLNELGDSGSKVSDILQEKTGKSFTDLMNDGYSLSDVLSVVYDSVGNDSTALMNLWGSAEAGKASNAIVNQGLGEFNENLHKLADSAGATESAYGTMADTTSTKIDRMKTNFEALGTKIFEKLETPLNNAISFVTDKCIPGLEMLSDNLGIIIPVIGGLTAAIVTFKAAMAISGLITAAVKSFNAYKAAQEGATVAQWLMNAAMNANPAVLIVTLIAGLIAAIVLLWNTNEDFRNGVITVWEAIRSAVTAVIEGLVNFFTKTVPAYFEKVINWVKSNWQGLLLLLVNPFAGAFKLIYDNCEGFRNKVNAILSAVIAFFTQKIPEGFGKFMDWIKSNWQGLLLLIVNPFAGAFKLIYDNNETFRNKVNQTFENVRSSISEKVNAAKETAVSAFENIRSSIGEKIELARDTVKKAIDKIRSFFNFTWELPKLKLPHFRIDGGFSLDPPSVPKFDIDWYAKGGILTKPTIFDYDPKSSRISVGGEAGAEAVAPIDTLLGFIRTAVQEENSGLSGKLDRVITILEKLLLKIPTAVLLDSGVLVGELAPEINEALGNISEKDRRWKG